MLSSTTVTPLREALRAGLSIFQSVWNYKAVDWITTIHAADINNDSYLEIIACSREGRIFAFDKNYKPLWMRVVGHKRWIGAIASIEEDEDTAACILVGTRDGKLYAFTQDGKTVGKDGTLYSFDKDDGKASERDAEIASCWLDIGAPICQISVDTTHSPDVIVGSEDGYAYAINRLTRAQHWAFRADGWVRAVCHSDIDGDGRVETLISSQEKTLFVVSEDGQLVQHLPMRYPIHALFVADIDQDGQKEILAVTDGKELVAFSPTLHKKWSRLFDNRLLSLYITDINRDGQQEIIAGSEDKHLYILNQHGERLWHHSIQYRAMSIYAADIDQDDQIEILVATDNDRAYAFKVELINDLEKRICSQYQAFSKTRLTSHTDLTRLLAADEFRLLNDIVGKAGQQREKLKHTTLQEIDQLMASEQHYTALVNLLILEHARVQVVLRRGKRHDLENIRSLCISHPSKDKRNIVIGTNDGDVSTFTVKGKRVGKINLGERILDVQTGYIDQEQAERLIVRTSSHKIYILPSTALPQKYEWERGCKTTCIYVNNGNRKRPSEIFTGSGTTITIYGEGLQTPSSSIELQEEVGIVHAYTRAEQETPEIIAGSANRSVYAYKRNGLLPLWCYEVRDRVRSLDMKDIDKDGEVEVIIGSEDRNIHVLDSRGRLRWRFFLPNTVQTVQAIDIDQDDRIEILAGCADGWLYVFSKDGDLRWKYRASDRIRALTAADIDDDEKVEIVIGAEDELEIISVLDLQQVQERIEKCVAAIQGKRSLEDVYAEMIHPSRPEIPAQPTLRAFAIVRLAKLPNQTQAVFDMLERYAKDSDADVRIAVIQAISACYALDEQRATHLLNQFAQDINLSLEIKLAFIEQIPLLKMLNWQIGFAHLEHFFLKDGRMVRRAVVRRLNQLIDMSSVNGAKREIFMLLLKAARDEHSVWIQQEAARVLAHFLDTHRERLIIYMHLLLVNELHPEVMDLIGQYATLPVVRDFIVATRQLAESPHHEQIPAYLHDIVAVMEQMTWFDYGRDGLQMYEELSRLFALPTLESIATYQCPLTRDDFSPHNELAKVFMDVLKQINTLIWHFGIYLRRTGILDRLTSLLDAQKALNEVSTFVERAYSGSLMGYSMKLLPDHLLIAELLRHWQAMVQVQQDELRGVVELKVELQTKSAPYEERIVVLFKLSNTGRQAADNVKLSLLHSDDFEIIGNLAVEVETLLSFAERQAEFTLKLRDEHLRTTDAAQAPQEEAICALRLSVEVAYQDTEHHLKTFQFDDQLELVNSGTTRDFRYITNRYSTGTPIQKETMFYGRDDDVAALRHNLADTEAQTILLLYGQRRTGKTTLLLHLARTSVLSEHIPVFIDMQRESFNISVPRFLYHLAHDIAQTMIDKGYRLPLPEMQEYAADPTFVFDAFLSHVETLLHSQKLIILIDEFEELEEQIKRGRLMPEFLDYLRSIMQHHKVNFLLAGAHRLDQLMQANWEVFFNIARQYRLSKLSQQGAEALIKEPVAEWLEYSPFTVEKIRQLTADQPYLIHLLCRALVDLCNDQRKVYVTLNDVNVARREAMRTCAAHFEWLWKHLTLHEQHLLAVISALGKEDGRWVSYAEIEERYRSYQFAYEGKNLRTGLKALELADILEAHAEDRGETPFLDERFRIPAGLMRMWLLLEKPLGWLLSEQQTSVS